MRPLRDLIFVQRTIEEKSAGGIVLLHDYRARKSPRLTMTAKSDYWAGRVLAVGPEVFDLSVGEEILIYTFADDTGHRAKEYVDGPGEEPKESLRSIRSGLYTGIFVAKGQAFIRPDDIVCVLDRKDGEALPRPWSMQVDQDPALNWVKRTASKPA